MQHLVEGAGCGWAEGFVGCVGGGFEYLVVERGGPFPLTQAGPNRQLETLADEGGSGEGVPTHSVRKRLVIDCNVRDSKPANKFQVCELGKGNHRMG